MKIKIDKSAIKKIGNNIGADAEDLRSEKEKIKNIVETLSNSWEGNDATEVINILKDNYLPKLEKLCERVEKCGSYLKSIDTVYDQLDSTYKAKKISE